MTTEADCTCDWQYGSRVDNPACPYHHPKK
jgi:hypothetical protein